MNQYFELKLDKRSRSHLKCKSDEHTGVQCSPNEVLQSVSLMETVTLSLIELMQDSQVHHPF